MNTYQKVSTILALSLYVPIAVQIVRGKIKQNLASWVLWGTTDAFITGSIVAQSGNWYLSGAFALGCFVVVLCLIGKGDIVWTKLETVSCVCVCIGLVGWMTSGPWLATILLTASVLVSSIPQFKDAYLEPHTMPLITYSGYVISNGLSVLGGKGWTIEERLFPVVAFFLATIFALVCFRRFFVDEPKPCSA